MDYATCLSATWRRTTTAKRDDFHSKSLFLVKKIKDNGTQKAVQRQRMGILLCEQNFRDVRRRNKSVRAEIGQILRTQAAQLVVRIIMAGMLTEERRRWPIITASPRGQCSKQIQNLEGEACSDEGKPYQSPGRMKNLCILPRSGIELTTFRTP